MPLIVFAVCQFNHVWIVFFWQQKTRSKQKIFPNISMSSDCRISVCIVIWMQQINKVWMRKQANRRNEKKNQTNCDIVMLINTRQHLLLFVNDLRKWTRQGFSNTDNMEFTKGHYALDLVGCARVRASGPRTQNRTQHHHRRMYDGNMLKIHLFSIVSDGNCVCIHQRHAKLFIQLCRSFLSRLIAQFLIVFWHKRWSGSAQ